MKNTNLIEELLEEFRKKYSERCSHGVKDRWDFKEYTNSTMIESFLRESLEKVREQTITEWKSHGRWITDERGSKWLQVPYHYLQSLKTDSKKK